jgi:hypothetical protein
MAFIEGPSLADRIKERPLPLPEALDIAIQIAAGLSAVPDRISLCGPQANDS